MKTQKFYIRNLKCNDCFEDTHVLEMPMGKMTGCKKHLLEIAEAIKNDDFDSLDICCAICDTPLPKLKRHEIIECKNCRKEKEMYVTCHYCKIDVPEHEAVRIKLDDDIVWCCLICEDENYESIHETDDRE